MGKKGPLGLGVPWHSDFEEETFSRWRHILTTPRFRRIGKRMWSKRARRSERRDINDGKEDES